MRKIVLGILSLLAILVTIAFLIVRRRKMPERTCVKSDTKVIGMREIENPFEEIVPQPEGENADVVVVIKDYNWRAVYKNDIITIVGVVVVVIMIVVFSVFAYMSRECSESTGRAEKDAVVNTVTQKLSNIEKMTVDISKRVDSLDVHFKDETTKIRNMIKPTGTVKSGERKQK